VPIVSMGRDMRFRRLPDLSRVPIELLERELRRRGLVTVSAEHEELADDLVTGRLRSVDTSWVLGVVDCWQSVAEGAIAFNKELMADCKQLMADRTRLREECARSDREAGLLAMRLSEEIDFRLGEWRSNHGCCFTFRATFATARGGSNGTRAVAASCLAIQRSRACTAANVAISSTPCHCPISSVCWTRSSRATPPLGASGETRRPVTPEAGVVALRLEPGRSPSSVNPHATWTPSLGPLGLTEMNVASRNSATSRIS
jgi:hypothetical protein